MKVLHVIESLEHGGAERVVVDLANGQRGSGVACLKRGGELQERLADHVRVHRIGKPEGIDLAAAGRLARAARDGGYDIVHTHAWGVLLDGALAARRAGARHVHTVHGPLPARPRGVLARLKAWLRLLAERRLVRRSTRVVAVSDAVGESAARRLGLRAVATIRNGIGESTESVTPGGALADALRRVRAAGPRLISVGRLDPVKDHATLLRALASLTDHWPSLELLLVGDGPERERLEQQAARDGLADRVRFLGFRDDVDELLSVSDIFVMSSRHEGISIAMLEAMRAELPIVATAVGGVPETVRAGASALLVGPGDHAGLAAAVARLVREPELARALGAAARDRQQRHFTLAAMVAAYDGIYADEVADESRPALNGVGDARVAVGGAGAAGPAGGLEILYHHRTQGRGAEGVHIASIVRALEGLGHRVTIVGPSGVDPLTTAGEAPVDKASVASRGANAVWSWVSRRLPGALFEVAEIGYNVVAYRQLARVMRGRRFDLVYERYAFYLVAGAILARRHGIPFVLEANEVSGLQERARRQVFPGLCARIERFLLARCAGVLPVSSFLAEALHRQGVPDERVQVVPNAVDDSVLLPVARDPDLIQRYGLNGRTVIGFVGWFDHWDRLDLLVEACARLKPAHPELAVLLVGDGPAASGLRHRVRALGLDGDVVMTGAVARAQVHAHMALLDVAVLPHSNQFGSPVVLFELMARQVPVVAPRLAPLRDVIEHDTSGLLFEPLDVDALTASVERLLDRPRHRRRLAANAYMQLLERHTWTHNAGRILDAAGFDSETSEPQEVRRAS